MRKIICSKVGLVALRATSGSPATHPQARKRKLEGTFVSKFNHQHELLLSLSRICIRNDKYPRLTASRRSALEHGRLSTRSVLLGHRRALTSSARTERMLRLAPATAAHWPRSAGLHAANPCPTRTAFLISGTWAQSTGTKVAGGASFWSTPSQ